MLLVALESSTRSPSIAVYFNGESRFKALDGDRPHASDLLPQLEALLGSLKASPKDITHVAVGTGPGSYTGLRVGIATAQGITRAAGAKLIGIPSVEALAFSELSAGECGDLLLDARGGGIYHARYKRTDDGVSAEISPRVVPLEEFDQIIKRSSIALLDLSLKERVQVHPLLRPTYGVTPRADSIVALALERFQSEEPRESAPVLPLYLRPFEGRVRKR